LLTHLREEVPANALHCGISCVLRLVREGVQTDWDRPLN
jgi:hypothetical protein